MAIDPREGVSDNNVLVDWKEHYRDFEASIQPDIQIARDQAEAEVRAEQAGNYIRLTRAELEKQPPTPDVVAHEYTLDRTGMLEDLATGNTAGFWTSIEDNQRILGSHLNRLKAGTLVVCLNARSLEGRHGTRLSIEAKVLEQDVDPVFGFTTDEQSIPRRDVLADEARVLPYPENSLSDNYTVETLLHAAVVPLQAVEGEQIDMLIGEDTVIAYAVQHPSEKLYVALKQAGVDLAETLPVEYGPVAHKIEQEEVFYSELDRLASQMADRLEGIDEGEVAAIIGGEDHSAMLQKLQELAPDYVVARGNAAQDVYFKFEHGVMIELEARRDAQIARLKALGNAARLGFRDVQLRA